MSHIKRRTFLADSLKGTALLAGTSLNGLFNTGKILGANERINIALIGCGGRGRFVARGLVEQGAVLTYLCDLCEERLEETKAFISDVQSLQPKLVKDYRTVLDAEEVNAVIIATPDHWHGPLTVYACQANKDVYVEKPHAHNIWESFLMIKTAEKYNRIVQVGTQNRSAPYNLKALEYVKSGNLGTIGLVKVYNLKSGIPFFLGQPEEKPKSFNWDVWLGPTENRPYHQNIFNSGWHMFWDFSGGDLADDGIHQLDLALMLLGDPGLPKGIACSGGRFVHKGDDAEVPDVQIAHYEFPHLVMTLEMTNYPRYMQKTTATIRRNDLLPYWSQNATRIELYGSELMMTIGRHGGGWQVTTSGGKVVDQMYGRPADEPHYQNFLDCIKSRKKTNADIRIAQNACLMVHMANIAYRIGNKKLLFDSEKKSFDDIHANQLIKRQYRKEYELRDVI